MHIQSLVYPGVNHPAYCEDHVFYQHMDHGWFIGAVMDGCSSGMESHFASALYLKSIRKACRRLHLSPSGTVSGPAFSAHEAIGTQILHALFEDVRRSMADLSLDLTELLSTLLLLVFRIEDRTAWINVSGDGLIIDNGHRIEIDQQNMPDYLAYHLDADPENWHRNHTRTHHISNVRDLVISTDGLLKLYPDPHERSTVKDPAAYLLSNDIATAEKDSLISRLDTLIRQHNCVPFDDLGLVRLLC